MPITSPISTAKKTPGSYIEVLLGVGPASAGDAPRKVLLVGHMLAGGTATADTAYPIFSEEDAKTLFGQGSELHRMVKAAFAAYKGVTLYGVGLTPPGGGTAASGDIVFAGTATADGTFTIEVAGELIEVAVADGEAAATIGTNVRDAINDLPDLPVAATLAVATVTCTARHTGTRGNNISLRSSGTVAGITPTHHSGYLTSGAGADTLTSALAAVSPTRYHLIAICADDATGIASWRTHVNDNAAPEEGRRQQVVCATKDTLANAITLATGVNAARAQVAWHYNADDAPSEVAASVAATRAFYEGRDPAAPMSQVHGTLVSPLRPQPVEADRPLSTETDSALNNGLTPITLDNAGNAYIGRSVTSRSQDSGGAPDYRVLDTSKVTATDYVADQIQVWWSGFVLANPKFAPDDADGNPPPPGVCTPKTIKDGIYAELKALEPQITTNVDTLKDQLVVEAAASPAGRALALIPADIVEGAYQLAATVQQVG